MLYLAGFPIFLLVFVGILTFFIWKIFSSDKRSDSRRIFEFYLSANEILREDDRRWFGFEIQETIARGETILSQMSTAPPLVHYALGALHHKLGDHASAIKYLGAIEENPEEIKIIFPTKDLRDYVRVLRKIERAPAEAPLTSAAIRSLERARRNRAAHLLEVSRTQIEESVPQLHEGENPRKYRTITDSVIDAARDSDDDGSAQSNDVGAKHIDIVATENATSTTGRVAKLKETDRKTISEVLHDIYDTNIS